MREIVVVPVPRGMTDEEALAEIDAMGRLVEWRWWHRFTRRPRWVAWEVGG